MNLPRNGTNQLPKNGFDWIALKVIYQGRKSLNLTIFFNFDTFCPFIQHLFSNVFSIVTWSFPRMVTIKLMKQWTVNRRIWLKDLIGHFRGQKGQVCSFSETVHVLTNVCMKHFYKVICNISIYLVTFDLGLPLNVKSRSHTFKGLCLINGASYDQMFYEIHIVSHMWSFSLPLI